MHMPPNSFSELKFNHLVSKFGGSLTLVVVATEGLNSLLGVKDVICTAMFF